MLKSITLLVVFISFLLLNTVSGLESSKCKWKHTNYISKRVWYVLMSFAQIDFYSCNTQNIASEKIDKASFTYKVVLPVLNSIFKSQFKSKIDTELVSVGSILITQSEKEMVKSLVDNFDYSIKRNDVLDLTMSSIDNKLCLLYRPYYNLDVPLYEKCVDIQPEKFDIIVSYLKGIKIN